MYDQTKQPLYEVAMSNTINSKSVKHSAPCPWTSYPVGTSVETRWSYQKHGWWRGLGRAAQTP